MGLLEGKRMKVQRRSRQRNNRVETKARVRSQIKRNDDWRMMAHQFNGKEREMKERKGAKQVGDMRRTQYGRLLQYSPGEQPVVRAKHYEADVWAEKQPSLLYY